MANYRPFLGSSAKLQIDIDGPLVSTSPKSGYVRGLIEALEGVGGQTGAALSQMPAEDLPAELTLAFDLTALDGGGFAISRGAAGANVHVSMRWSSRKKAQKPRRGPARPGSMRAVSRNTHHPSMSGATGLPGKRPT